MSGAPMGKLTRPLWMTQVNKMSHMRQDEKVLAAVRSLKQIGFDLVTIRKTLPALTGITHPVAVEISAIVATTDRCVKAVVRRTGKVANFPRRITDFAPGTAIVPAWLAMKICPAPAGNERGVDVPGAESGAGR